MPSMSSETTSDLMERAGDLFQAKQDEEALLLYRVAINRLLSDFKQNISGEILMQLLYCFRSLAVSACITGRASEGRLAVGTAIMYASVGLKYWPSAPQLVEERSQLMLLAEKLGGVNTVLVSDESVEWVWPFDD